MKFKSQVVFESRYLMVSGFSPRLPWEDRVFLCVRLTVESWAEMGCPHCPSSCKKLG